MMKAARDRREGFSWLRAQDIIMGRNKMRLELWEEHKDIFGESASSQSTDHH